MCVHLFEFDSFCSVGEEEQFDENEAGLLSGKLSARVFASGFNDPEDDEADRIYAQIDDKMAERRRSRREKADLLADAPEANEDSTTAKMLFVDFTGFTCTNCRWMETKMFPLADVKSRLDGFIKVKLFTDRNSEPYLSNKKLQEERYGSIELPLYVIMKPNEELVGTNTFTRDKEAFIQFLDKGLKALK